MKPGARIFGSARGLVGSERKRVVERFGQAGITLIDTTCRELFDDERCVV